MSDSTLRPDFLSDPYRVGEWCVDPVAREVWRSDDESKHPHRRTRIDPKPLHVLAVLAESQGRVVTRAELFDRVWPDTIVVEEALTRCVTILRKAFRECPDDPSVIETVRGSGYRLRPHVSPLTGTSAHLNPVHVASSGRKSSRMPLVAAAGVFTVIIAGLFAATAGEPQPVSPPSVFRATVMPGVERDADLTSDGSRMVFAASRDGRSFYLVVTDSVGGPARALDIPTGGARVTGGAGAAGTAATVRTVSASTPGKDLDRSFRAPVWSPDGERLAFLLREGRGCTVVVAGADGSRPEEIGSCAGAWFSELDWSPDGSRLLFSVAGEDGPPESLIELAVDGSERTILTDGGGARYGDHHGVYSPDGRRIAFIRTPSEAESDIHVMDLDTGIIERVTFDRAIVTGLDWTSDDALVYSSNRNGQFQLWRTRTLSCDCPPEWVPTGTENAYDPKVALQTGAISFYHDRTTSSIHSLANGAERAVISNASTNRSPHISPDGDRVVYVSTASGARELWISARDGSDARPATELGAYTDAPRWSPDGRWVAFNSSPDGHQDLHLLDVAKGSTERITFHEADETNARWSRDGSRLYFTSNREGEWSIHVMDPFDTEAGVTSTGIPGVLVEETGGGVLLVTRPDRPGLHAYTEAFEYSHAVLPHLEEFEWGGWVVDGESVVHVEREEDAVRLMRTPIAGGISVPAGTISTGTMWDIPWQSASIDVFPDGSGFLFVRYDAAEGEISVLRP